MNKKFLFAVLVAVMLLASGCISIIKYDENGTAEDIAGDLEDVEEDLADAEEIEKTEEDLEDSATEALPTKTVVEGEIVTFPNLKAVDPDGDPITYTFSKPLDEDGEWKTQVGDAGEYKVTITASDGVSQVSQDVLVIVKSSNKAPVISLADVTVDEGETVKISPVVTDADGDSVEISLSGWMESSSKETGFDDAGEYEVTVTASDGKTETEKTIKVIVNDVNRAPVIGDLADITIDEEDDISVDAEVSDPDGDNVKLTFSEPLDDEGEWKTQVGDAGEYTVKVIASDGDLEAEKIFRLTVNALNKAPVFSGVENIQAVEGEKIKLDITAEDPDGDDVAIEFGEPFNENGEWQTGFDDAGEYEVTVTASDGIVNVAETFAVVVEDRNRPPTFDMGSFE